MMTKILLLLSAVLMVFIAINQFVCSSKTFAPEIKGIKDVQIMQISDDSLKLKLTVIAENNNIISLGFNDLSLFVVNNTDTLGLAYNGNKLSIPGKSVQDIGIYADLKTSKVAGMLAKNEDTLKLNLKGILNVSVLLISIPVEIDMPFALPLKNELYKSVQNDSQKEKIITIENASLQSLGISESLVKIEFSLKNPYALKFKLKNYPSKIYINGSYAGEGSLSDEIEVGSGSSKVSGQFLFKVDNYRSVVSVLGALLGGKLKYETKGDLLLEIAGREISLPYTSTGALNQL
ncbi:MAG: hypothetical protein WCJ01_12030 [Ignavibacteria bacterium]